MRLESANASAFARLAPVAKLPAGILLMKSGRIHPGRWLDLSADAFNPASLPARISAREGVAWLAVTALVALAICFVPPRLSRTIDYIAFYSPNFHFLWETLRE